MWTNIQQKNFWGKWAWNLVKSPTFFSLKIVLKALYIEMFRRKNLLILVAHDIKSHHISVVTGRVQILTHYFYRLFFTTNPANVELSVHLVYPPVGFSSSSELLSSLLLGHSSSSSSSSSSPTTGLAFFFTFFSFGALPARTCNKGSTLIKLG